MKNGVKEMVIRAARTFFQAAIGYLVANVALIKWDDAGAAKTTVLTVVTAAVACGLAALMNLPRGNEGGTGESLLKNMENLEKQVAEQYEYMLKMDDALDSVDKRTAVKWDRPETCPDWLRPTVKKLVEKDLLTGDQNGHLMLTTDLARMLVIFDRAGGFEE